MNPTARIAHLSLWTAWTFTAALAAFALVTSDIPFSNKEISLYEASAKATWTKIFSRDSAIFWLLTGLSCCAVLSWTKIKNPHARLWFTATIFLLPVAVAIVTADCDKIGTWLISFLAAPLVVYELFFGKLDGEFYAECTLLFAALGSWSLLWLTLLVIELRKNASAKTVISPYSFPTVKSR
jgi:hypothetical protein